MGAKIVEEQITLTRGDTLRTKVTIYLDESKSEEYTPVAGDIIKFAVKQYARRKGELISIIIPNDTMELHIKPEDTSALDFNTYKYDIQLTRANGDVHTVIGYKNFKITEEVAE